MSNRAIGMEAIKTKFTGMERFTKPTTKAKQTWSGVEVVDYLQTQFDIPILGPFGYSSWLRRVKTASISLHHAQKLIGIMVEREKWLQKEKGEKLHRGKWMFNQFRHDIKTLGIDKFISKNSR